MSTDKQMKIKLMIACTALFPSLVWGGLYLFYMAAFGGLLPYNIGSPTPRETLCWFVMLCVVSIIGFYISLLLVYKHRTDQPWAIVLLAMNMFSTMISVPFIILLVISIYV